MRISMIAAMSKNQVIGIHNTLPWHLPADLKHFKTITMGKPIIMGHKTFESIGRPLPGRTNIILTRQSITYDNCIIVHSVTDALQLTAAHEETIVIGGAQIYQTFLPYATRLYLTIVDTIVEGDAFFPKWNKEEWQVVQEAHLDKSNDNPFHLTYLTLERNPST